MTARHVRSFTHTGRTLLLVLLAGLLLIAVVAVGRA